MPSIDKVITILAETVKGESGPRYPVQCCFYKGADEKKNKKSLDF
jgi:hypothetical protein